MSESMGKTWSADDIARVIYSKRRPKNWRNAVTTTMRGLVAKQAKQKVRVKKVSGIGRGKLAEYRLINRTDYCLNERKAKCDDSG
jgi:hypothetical protein